MKWWHAAVFYLATLGLSVIFWVGVLYLAVRIIKGAWA